MSPEREAARDSYRERISQFIAGLAVCTQVETPQLDIGYDSNEIIS